MAEERTLKVCLMKEIPASKERDPNYLYFAFDKLALFFGRNQYFDPFVICEAMPDNPVIGCLYITFEGNVYCYIDDKIITIATIEDPSEAEILSHLGTTYFMHADQRYIEPRRRLIHLPYNNGTYSLSVGVAKDQMVNDRTVIRYDTEHERWYMDGEHWGPPLLRGYKGKWTESVETNVYEKCIHANVRLSPKDDNLLQIVKGGLYATVSDKLEKDDLSGLADMLEQFIADTNSVMEKLQEEIDSVTGLVSEEYITELVHEALVEYYADIDKLIEAYNELYDLLYGIEQESKEYTDQVFDEKATYLGDLIINYFADGWEPY